MIDKGKKGVCPPLRGNSMTSLRIMFVLMLIIMVVLLATGCVGQGGEGKSAGNVISPVPTTASIPTQTLIEPYQVSQEGYWIKIDPVSDKQIGDIFIVTSTTNVSVGEEILVQVYSSNFYTTGKFYGITGTVSVVRGRSGINTISFIVNSSTLKPDEYIVTEDAVIHQATGTALFNVLPPTVSSGKTPLKPKNFIDWENLDLPPLKINNSMQMENPPFANPDSCQTTDGSIILFSPDGIVRIFDKNGAQIGACYDSRDFHSYGVPSGSIINIGGNVSTVTFGGERILTQIFEAGN
jgi:hypothetical protein